MTNHLSPAQRHAARVLAAKAAAQSKHGEAIQGSAYQLMLAKLINDKQRLKKLQSVQRKIELKREILPEYDDWIDGALQYGNGAQDQVLSTVLVWHIDASNFARALDIARYCMVHKLNLPDEYSRDIPTMLLDEIPGAYLEGRFASQAQAIETLRAVQLLTVNEDAPDQASAKLYKALGYAQIGKTGSGDIDFDQLSEADASKAIDNLRKALELFQAIGVKKDIERLERRLKKTVEGESADNTAPPPTT